MWNENQRIYVCMYIHKYTCVLWESMVFKSTVSLSSFTFIKRLFSSSSLSAIRVVSSAYLRFWYFLRQSWFQLVLIQFSSVAQLCPALCNPKDCCMPGLPVYHQILELTQTHVHWVDDAIQPSHALSSPSPHTLNLSQHQGLQWVSSSHQVARVL